MTFVKLTAGGAHGSQLFRVLDGPGQPLGQLFGSDMVMIAISNLAI